MSQPFSIALVIFNIVIWAVVISRVDWTGPAQELRAENISCHNGYVELPPGKFYLAEPMNIIARRQCRVDPESYIGAQ